MPFSFKTNQVIPTLLKTSTTRRYLVSAPMNSWEATHGLDENVKYYKGREKGLLREALTGILPDDVLWRKKSPYPKTHNPNYTLAVQKWMNIILKDKSSPILQIINCDKVQEIVDSGGKAYGKPWYGQLMTGPQLIAYLIQVDTWLREYKVIIE